MDAEREMCPVQNQTAQRAHLAREGDDAVRTDSAR